MPTEVRRLIFSDAELTEALTDHLRASSSGDPGIILATEASNDQRLVVRAQVQLPSGRQDRKVFDEHTLCSALIAYCLNKAIPLSREAQKAVHLNRSGAVVLDIAIRNSLPRANEARPAPSGAA